MRTHGNKSAFALRLFCFPYECLPSVTHSYLVPVLYQATLSYARGSGDKSGGTGLLDPTYFCNAFLVSGPVAPTGVKLLALWKALTATWVLTPK